MSAARPEPRSIRPASNRWSVVLRVVALLAAWQGPLPWCHCHDSLLAPRGTPQASWLASHLRAYHVSAERPATSLGWHWHVELPGTTGDDARPTYRCRPDSVVSRATGEAFATELNEAAEQATSWWVASIDVAADPLGADRESLGSPSFFASFAPRAPLSERFGVLRI